VLVVLLVFGPNLVDTKVEIVFSQPSQVLVEEEVSMAAVMVLETQKMVAVEVEVATETLVELEQQIKGLGEEVAQQLQTAILVAEVVVHLPLAAMRQGKMAAMVVQELTHQ
jgi:DNA-binding XRE family transcriptional regulator